MLPHPAVMEMNLISTTLWQISIATKVLLVVLVLVTRVHRSHPLFCAYAIALALRSLALWGISRTDNYPAYFYVFWISQGILATLALGVVWEIYRDTLAVFPSIRRWTSPVFGISLVVLLIFCIWAVIAAPANLSSRMVSALVLLERSVWAVQTGVLLLLVGTALLAGLSLRTPSFGMALGLGLHSATELGMLALVAIKGEVVSNLQVLGGHVGFLTGMMVWTISLLAFRHPQRAVAPGQSAVIFRDEVVLGGGRIR